MHIFQYRGETYTHNHAMFYIEHWPYPSHDEVVQGVDKMHEFDPQQKHAVDLLVDRLFGVLGGLLFRRSFLMFLSSYGQI